GRRHHPHHRRGLGLVRGRPRAAGPGQHLRGRRRSLDHLDEPRARRGDQLLPRGPPRKTDAMSTGPVTGGSGFIAAHCILKLLDAGHTVRATVRSLKREADVRAMLKEGGAEPGGRFTLAEADLLQDAGWAAAVTGCERVLHVASPFP